MKLFQLLLSVFIIFCIVSCSSKIVKPYYKPSVIKSNDAREVWDNNQQYLTGQLNYFGNKVKVFAGNNGTTDIKLTTPNGTEDYKGVGLYIEVENTDDENVKVLTNQTIITDRLGNNWQILELYSDDNLKEKKTQTLGVNIKTYTVSNENGVPVYKSNDYQRVVQDVEVKNNSTGYLTIVLATPYKSFNELPSEFVLNLKCKRGDVTENQVFPFNAIEW